jgi:Methyltransferase domain
MPSAPSTSALAPNNGYLLGHAGREQRRLIEQARLIDDLTARLFQATGLRQGMHVLDVGRVIGIDASREAIATAAQRAAAAGLNNVSFIQSSTDDIDSLSERLHAQALQLDATLTLFSFIGAWSSVPTSTGDCS